MSQKNEKIFEYNGCSYEFDIATVDDSEKYEKAIDLMTEEEKEIPKAGRLSEIYRGQCKLIKNFFDRVLGDNAGNKLCGEKDNITDCYNAYSEFLNFVSAQRDSVIAVKNTFAKYSNRAQRRAAEHKK